MAISKSRYQLEQHLESAFDQHKLIGIIKEELRADSDTMDMIHTGTVILKDWVFSEHVDDKAERLQSVQVLDLDELAFNIIAQITAFCQKPQTLVAVSARCASMLNLADKASGIQTMAEIISVLRDSGLYSIRKHSQSREASYMVMSFCQLEGETLAFLTQTHFLPPMIHRPKKLRHNRSSGYTTQQGKGSLILGGFANHHDWDICLDVLNIQNSIEFELDTEVLSTIEEPKPKALEVDESVMYISSEQRRAEQFAIDHFDQYKVQCYYLYSFYIHSGNSLYFNHKVDKRGRVYTCGYHLSPQGNSFKKAMLNLKKQDTVQGVADFLKDCK